MGDKMPIEQIIDTIKRHPVLYDSTLSSRKDREALWEEIADTFDLDVQILKAKWKSLRDCYNKHIRAQTDDSKAVSSYKRWHWSKYLEFLRPHVRSHTEVVYSNDTDDEHNMKEPSENVMNVKLEEVDHTNFGSDFETICIKQPKLRAKHSSNNFGSDSDNLECVIEQPNRKKRRIISTLDTQGFSDIELIFLGYAKTVKKMPLKRQISVKIKIAKIMMEEELKCLE